MDCDDRKRFDRVFAVRSRSAVAGKRSNTLELGAIGPKAQIDVNGNVGTMSVSQVDLGPTGHVIIAGQLNTNDLTAR